MKVSFTLNLLLSAALLATICMHAVQAQDADASTVAEPEVMASPEQGYDSSYAPAAPRDGSVVRVDIPSDDLAESREFYEEAFGWTFTEPKETKDRIIDWKDPAGNTGGISTFVPSGDGGGVVIYLHSDDIDESFKRINRAGGRSIDFTMEIEEGRARVGLFTDPQGNMLGLISPNA